MPLEITAHPVGVQEEIEAQISRVIRKTVFDIDASIKRSMAEPKTGRRYARGKAKGKRQRFHQASAPGESPAIDTGFLVNSMTPTFPSKTEGILDIGAEYAPHLEYGAENAGRSRTVTIEPRPFVGPAIRDVLTQLQKDDEIESFTGIDELGRIG